MTTTLQSNPVGPADPASTAPSSAPAAHGWTWLIQYGVIAIFMLALTMLLAGMELFQTSVVVRMPLTAAKLVLAVGQGGALVMLWLAAQRAATQLAAMGGRFAHMPPAVTATVLLIVVMSAYGVLLPVLRLFMDPALLKLYKWLFVGGITACAIWLAVVLFKHSAMWGESAR